MTTATPAQRLLTRSQRTALTVGVAGALASIVGAFFNPDQFFRSYLIALLFWLGIALGSLGLLMIYHLVGGTWGFILRRILEAATLTLPLLALVWLPLALGYQHIYPWATAGALAGAEAAHRRTYLSFPFWFGRAVAYWLIWSVIAYVLNRLSRLQDQAATPVPTARLVRLSPPGLILLVLTVSFAWIDWVMSLEPDWYSTIFGFIALVGHGMAALCFALIVVLLLIDREPFATLLGDKPSRLNDLGNLLLTFVMLWAYTSFSQFLIIWYGNLQRETVWYRHRMAGAWEYVALALIVLHFFVPFLLLLSRSIKRRPQILLGLAAGLLLMHLIDIWWQVLPAFHPTGLSLHWQDIVAPIALGGLWLAASLWLIQRRPLLAQRDPHAPQLVAYAGAEPAT
ncbi:MAG: hypothetical protein H0X37_02015 [Herpetosiphonaceae bacterium]|nr:hypothetical protein [Herpetosiphonaceae bacterium]